MGILERLFRRHEPVYTRPMPKGYITVTKAAELLGLKTQQIRDMIKAGLIPEEDLEKVGNAWLIKEERAMSLRPRKKGRPYGKKVTNI